MLQKRKQNAHFWRIKQKRKQLFPSNPTGPFCFLKQQKHQPAKERSFARTRRSERRLKFQQREFLWS